MINTSGIWNTASQFRPDIHYNIRASNLTVTIIDEFRRCLISVIIRELTPQRDVSVNLYKC